VIARLSFEPRVLGWVHRCLPGAYFRTTVSWRTDLYLPDGFGLPPPLQSLALILFDLCGPSWAPFWTYLAKNLIVGPCERF